MKCMTPFEQEAAEVASASEVRLPMGLLGFERIKEYVLIADPEEEPFFWLQVKGDPSLAFIVINPFLVAPDYAPDLPAQDTEFLGLSRPDDALLFNIVTLHGPGRATVNLKGPIVVNRHTWIGKQVVVSNASDYSVQHPLPVAETAN
jgi:flagellar assembly factor FliW